MGEATATLTCAAASSEFCGEIMLDSNRQKKPLPTYPCMHFLLWRESTGIA